MWSMLEEKYIDKAEWFVKVDDDSYLFVDNLRHFAKFYNPNVPHFFGHTLPFRWKQDNIVFNSGVAYVLSRESLSRLAPVLRNMPQWKGGYRDRCVDRDGAGEDTSMGICLRSIGINPDNTLDHEYRQRFLLFSREGHERQKRRSGTWYWNYKPKIIPDAQNCCSDDMIVLHGFKGHKEDDTAFQNFENVYYRNGNDKKRDLRIPPKPSLFLYDPADLDFKIDAYLNAEIRNSKQEVFLGHS